MVTTNNLILDIMEALTKLGEPFLHLHTGGAQHLLPIFNKDAAVLVLTPVVGSKKRRRAVSFAIQVSAC